MGKAEDLKKYFEHVDEDKRQFAYDTVDEYCFLQEQMEKYKKLPLIRVSKNDPSKQQITPAAKQIKEFSQAIDAKRRTLLMILYRVENSAADELLEMLKGFDNDGDVS